jgi:hypothetical protein
MASIIMTPLGYPPFAQYKALKQNKLADPSDRPHNGRRLFRMDGYLWEWNLQV